MTRSQHRPKIVVGLVATPPDYPARVAARLTAEVVDRPATRVNADVRWTVRDGVAEAHCSTILPAGVPTTTGTSRSALTLATAVSYVVLFIGTLLAAALLIDTSVLQQTLQRPAHATDYLMLA